MRTVTERPTALQSPFVLMGRQLCTKCGSVKTSSCFSKSSCRKSGTNPWCKTCCRSYYSLNKERIRNQQKAYQSSYRQRPDVIAKRKVYSRTAHRTFGACARQAAWRHIAFDLTLEQFYQLRSSPCHYCGSPLPEAGHGLDRVNNTIGYCFDNVVPSCWSCNKIKGAELTYHEMIQVAALLKRIRRGVQCE